MDLRLAGKRALVTASTGGIGLATATGLAREQAHVIVNGRGADGVDAAIERIRREVPSASVEGVVADNSSAEGAAATVDAVREVDILVNSLGSYRPADIFDDDDDRLWQQMFDVNVMSAVRLSRFYLQRMLRAGGGRVVMLASEAALMPAPGMAQYSAAKTMLLGVARNLAGLTRGSQVTVNAIVAGSARTAGVTAMLKEQYPDLDPGQAEAEFMAGERSTSLIGRLIDPAEIADLITYVCSDRAAAINGAALRIDGGLVPVVI